jgi:hypothetical protein
MSMSSMRELRRLHLVRIVWLGLIGDSLFGEELNSSKHFSQSLVYFLPWPIMNGLNMTTEVEAFLVHKLVMSGQAVKLNLTLLRLD